MSKEYIDVVLIDVNGGRRLYRAPGFSYLEWGDVVRVEGQDSLCDVLASVTMRTDSKEFDLISKLVGDLKRVESEVRFTAMNYEEEGKSDE